MFPKSNNLGSLQKTGKGYILCNKIGLGGYIFCEKNWAERGFAMQNASRTNMSEMCLTISVIFLKF